PPNTSEIRYTGKSKNSNCNSNSVARTPTVPAIMLQKAPILVTRFHKTLAKATGPHDAANNVAANTEIQKIAGGCHKVNNKVIPATNTIIYLLIFNNFSSDIEVLRNKSLEILFPINCKNVELDDNAAAKIPLIAITPIHVGIKFIADQ